MHTSHRFVGILLVGGLAAAATANDVIDPAKAKSDDKAPLLWYDIRLLDVEGKGWEQTKAPFDRLPAKASGVVRPPVWGLSRNSAGMCVRFVTDATTLHARWTVTSDRLAMPHMPATAVSGPLRAFTKNPAPRRDCTSPRATRRS